MIDLIITQVKKVCNVCNPNVLKQHVNRMECERTINYLIKNSSGNKNKRQ